MILLDVIEDEKRCAIAVVYVCKHSLTGCFLFKIPNNIIAFLLKVKFQGLTLRKFNASPTV
jgi:hypothetical protein